MIDKSHNLLSVVLDSEPERYCCPGWSDSICTLERGLASMVGGRKQSMARHLLIFLDLWWHAWAILFGATFLCKQPPKGLFSQSSALAFSTPTATMAALAS